MSKLELRMKGTTMTGVELAQLLGVSVFYYIIYNLYKYCKSFKYIYRKQ